MDDPLIPPVSSHNTHWRVIVDHTPLEKPALIRALRRLDALGVGRFLLGRRGQPTRFEWHEKSLTVRSLATDEPAGQPA